MYNIYRELVSCFPRNMLTEFELKNLKACFDKLDQVSGVGKWYQQHLHHSALA